MAHFRHGRENTALPGETGVASHRDGNSGFPVLQPIAPSPYPGPALADEAEGVGEPGRAGPPVLVGCDELVSAVAEGEEVEPEILAAGVDEPELGHAGLGVEKGEALGIPLLGRVAQDLYDQVRSPLDAVEAVWTPSRKEPHP